MAKAGFLYPEQLRDLRSRYPDTQFNAHGEVIGGTPINQYGAQPANPVAIPASVKTYSQFDPATNTWVRHTNGAAVVQSPAPASTPAPIPAQGTPINFQQVLGYTPAGFEGATLNIGSNSSPRQVMRPLPRNTGGRKAVNTPINRVTINGEQALAYGNQGKTPSGVEFVGGQPVTTPIVTEPIKVTPVVNMSPDHRESTPYTYNRFPVQVNADPAEIGQSIPRAEITPAIRGNGFLTWLGNALGDFVGFHSSSNLDPTLSNHSDPRW